jgi:hypothetical protein
MHSINNLNVFLTVSEEIPTNHPANQNNGNVAEDAINNGIILIYI